MAAKKHTFDIGTLSSAIDKIIVQGSKVFINFSGNEKTYEYSWKPANRILLEKLEGFVKNPESLSLGRFYNDSLKNGDLIQITVQYTFTTKVTKMAKSYTSRKRGSFSQKKRNLSEIEKLEESGMFDMLSNRQKLYHKSIETDENYDF